MKHSQVYALSVAILTALFLRVSGQAFLSNPRKFNGLFAQLAGGTLDKCGLAGPNIVNMYSTSRATPATTYISGNEADIVMTVTGPNGAGPMSVSFDYQLDNSFSAPATIVRDINGTNGVFESPPMGGYPAQVTFRIRVPEKLVCPGNVCTMLVKSGSNFISCAFVRVVEPFVGPTNQSANMAQTIAAPAPAPAPAPASASNRTMQMKNSSTVNPMPTISNFNVTMAQVITLNTTATLTNTTSAAANVKNIATLNGTFSNGKNETNGTFSVDSVLPQDKRNLTSGTFSADAVIRPIVKNNTSGTFLAETILGQNQSMSSGSSGKNQRDRTSFLEQFFSKTKVNNMPLTPGYFDATSIAKGSNGTALVDPFLGNQFDTALPTPGLNYLPNPRMNDQFKNKRAPATTNDPNGEPLEGLLNTLADPNSPMEGGLPTDSQTLGFGLGATSYDTLDSNFGASATSVPDIAASVFGSDKSAIQTDTKNTRAGVHTENERKWLLIRAMYDAGLLTPEFIQAIIQVGVLSRNIAQL